MLSSIAGIIIGAAIVFITIFCWKRAILRKKLWWVKTIHGHAILGCALDLIDSTKSLQTLRDYATRTNGLCYFEVLYEPNILISNSKVLEWLLSSNTVIKKGEIYQVLNRWLEGGILISSGDRWRNGRKILTPAFHFGILTQFVEVFEEPTNILIKILSKMADEEEVNLHPYILRYSLDVICQTSLGVQLDIQETANSEYTEAVGEMCRIVVERAFNPLKFFEWVYKLTPDYRKELRYVKLLQKVCDEIIEKRKREIESESEHDEDDFGNKKKLALLDLLLKYKDENGKPLTHNFIRSEVQTIMFAGHDTTAAALGFALYNLANHPQVQAKALEEVKDITDCNKKMTSRDLQEMKYLEMVFKETLRLYPSVPYYSRQTTEDVVYEEGKVIPKGVTLLVAASVTNRDPQVWENPDEFDPTRFLNKDIKPFTYLPFSAGPRNCIGQKFALLEMKFVLAKILLNFELLPGLPSSAPIVAAETVLKSVNGINVRLRKRL